MSKITLSITLNINKNIVSSTLILLHYYTRCKEGKVLSLEYAS